MAKTRTQLVATKIRGMADLSANMKALSKAVQTRIAHQATVAGAKPVRAEAKANIKRNRSIVTGSLLAAIIMKRLSKKETKLTSETIVTVRGRARKPTKGKKNTSKKIAAIAPHAHFVELGTVKMSARPFLAPAFESKKGEALNKMQETLDRGIAKATAGNKKTK